MNVGRGDVVIHLEPIDGERIDAVVYVDIPRWGRGAWKGDWEALPARRVAAGTAEIVGVPFRIYDVLRGDLVRMSAESELLEVVRPSDRVNARLAVTDPASRQILHPEIEAALVLAGCVYEVAEVGLFAIDFAEPDSQDRLRPLIRSLGDQISIESVLWDDNHPET
jgi:hypothetical protein